MVKGNRTNDKKKHAGDANERAKLKELFHVQTGTRFIASGRDPSRWERK
jgi:hypothetical protein